MFNNNQPQQPDCLGQIAAWWQSVPFGTKSFILICCAAYIIDSLTNYWLLFLFADFPKLVLNGQVQRLFFTQFLSGQFLNLLIGLLSVYFSAVVLERTVGTATFLIDVMVKSFFTQVLLIIITLPFLFIYPTLLNYPSFGQWNLLLVYISLRCFSNPDADSQFLCFPITIKNIYYPFAIILFMSIFQFTLSPIAAVLLGYLEYKFFNGMIYRPGQSTVQKIEQSFVFKSFLNRQDFVKGTQDFTLPQQSPSTQENSQQQSQPQPQQFSEYQGKGVKIGTEYGQTMPPQLVIQQLQKEQANQLEDNELQEIQTQEEGGEQKERKRKNYNQLGDEQV